MISGLFVGIAFGVLLQRTQFCFNSGFQNIFLQKNFRFLAALLIAVSIQAVGFFALAHFGLIRIPDHKVPILATLIGGFLLGSGMVICGYCASESWVRTGEGGIAPLLVLLAFSITMACGYSGPLRRPLGALSEQTLQASSVQGLLKISPWALVAALILITAVMVKISLSQKQPGPTPAHHLRGAAYVLFEKKFHLFFGAVLIGLLGVLAWYLSAQTGRQFGFSVAVPSANVMEYLVTGQNGYLNWGSLFAVGILAGSFVSALLSGGLELKSLPANEYPKRVFGGFLMGIGAVLTGGCTVANCLVSVAYFSIQGWLATFMILLGCAVATKFCKPSSCQA